MVGLVFRVRVQSHREQVTARQSHAAGRCWGAQGSALQSVPAESVPRRGGDCGPGARPLGAMTVLSPQCVNELNQWLSALRKASTNNAGLLGSYHPGVFRGDKWSCCHQKDKTGRHPAPHLSLGGPGGEASGSAWAAPWGLGLGEAFFRFSGCPGLGAGQSELAEAPRRPAGWSGSHSGGFSSSASQTSLVGTLRSPELAETLLTWPMF